MLASFPTDTQFSLSISHNAWFVLVNSVEYSTYVCCRWVGEKYDGIRCCWNPSQRIVYLNSILSFLKAVKFDINVYTQGQARRFHYWEVLQNHFLLLLLTVNFGIIWNRVTVFTDINNTGMAEDCLTWHSLFVTNIQIFCIGTH